MLHIQIPIGAISQAWLVICREKESLNASHSNTDWCNITGETCDMHIEESLNASHSNTD